MQGKPAAVFSHKNGMGYPLGRASKKDGESFQGSAQGLHEPPCYPCVPRAPVPLLLPVFSLTGSMMVLRCRTWMWRQTVFSLESGEFPSEQPPSAKPSGRELAHLFREIVGRATKALNIVLPEKSTAAASRFEAEAEESLRSEIPLLPDLKDILCRQFTSPLSYHRWSRQTKVFSNMAAQEQVCCGV